MRVNVPNFRVSMDPVGAPSVRSRLVQLPNALTIARILLAPVIAVLLLGAKGGHDWTAGVLFAVAGITDQADGWLARRWRAESEFGKRFDMLADGLVLGGTILVLVYVDRLPWLAPVLLGGREVVLGLTSLLMPPGFGFSASFLGRLSAWILYAGVFFIIVVRGGTDWALWVFWLGVALDLASGALYVTSACRTRRTGNVGDLSRHPD
jgi:CDP-diacylglycerol--glycerol-3-phosphate 3-phosphatidyltransferase